MSNHIKTQNVNPTVLNANPKNEHDSCEMSLSQQNITTCHMRHIFMPINQTAEKIIYLTQQFVKCNNSIPSNERWLLQVN